MICDTARIVNLSLRIRQIIVGASALGDLDYRAVVVASNTHNHAIECLGPDFPSHAGFGALLAACHLYWKQPILCIRNPFEGAGRRRDGAVVKIDADEIQTSAHLLHIAGLDFHDGFRQEGERIGISPMQGGFQEPQIGDGVSALGGKFVFFGIGGRLTGRHAQGCSHSRGGTSGF